MYQALHMALFSRILSLHSSFSPLKFFHFGDTNLPLEINKSYCCYKQWAGQYVLQTRTGSSCMCSSERLCSEPMPVFPTHKIPISLVFLEVPNVQIIMSVRIWIRHVSDFLFPPVVLNVMFLGSWGKIDLSFQRH